MDEGRPPGIHNVLKLSLKSSAQLLETLESRTPRLSDEHLEKIIKTIIWHRKFILSYYAVIAVVVLISGGLGVYQHVKGKPNKAAAPASLESVTSTTSTQGTTTPCGKHDSDTKNGKNDLTAISAPLLPVETTRPTQRPRVFDRIKSFLTYQPRPVAALTAPSNVLPDNGTSFLILFFLGVNLFYLFYKAPLSIDWIFVLADRAGLLIVVNLPILYLLAAKNNQPLKLLTGWSYEGLNLFHRRLGEWMVAISVLHLLGMIVVWYTVLRDRGINVGYFLRLPVVFFGFAAIISYWILYITSIGWFRRLYYETFLGLHILFQVGALGFVYFHYPTARSYVLATLLIWAVDRIVWRISLSARRFTTSLEVAPDGHTILMHCDVDLQRRLFGIRVGVHQGWLPGQHVFLTIPSMGFKYRFQTHPFTIASPGPPPNAKGSWPLVLVIRSLDGFTLDLLEYARNHHHCEVIMEGPHGGTEALEAAHRADRVLFVAGGSGIAVTYPLAWDVRVEDSMKPESPVVTRKVCKDGSIATSSVLRRGPLVAPSQYAHFWLRQHASHETWLTVLPRAASVKQRSSLSPSSSSSSSTLVAKDEAGEEVADIVTHAFDTRGPGGRPDIKSEIWNWVTLDYSSNSPSSPLLSSSSSSSSSSSASNVKTYKTFGDAKTADPKSRRERICILVSGPDGLVRDVRNISAQLIREGWNIEIWVEKFGW